MNALEIISQLHALKAEVLLEDDHLVIRGHGRPVPPELLSELHEHKADVMIALGAPMDLAVASVLSELRPNLPGALRRLSDPKLLALVNWSIMAAWTKTLRNLEVRGG